jgi:predicted ATPase
MRSIITRIQIENYKSIKNADVPLTDLTILIGPNGSGKSVFLEALTLIADALRFDLNQTLSGQGDIRPFRAPNARVFAPIPPFLQEYAPPELWKADTRSTRIKLFFQNPPLNKADQALTGSYELIIRPNDQPNELGWVVEEEILEVTRSLHTTLVERHRDSLRIDDQVFSTSNFEPQAILKHQLYLDELHFNEVRASHKSNLDQLTLQLESAELLSRAWFYNPSPQHMRDRNLKSPSTRLDKLAAKLPAVWYQTMRNSSSDEARIIIDYMRVLVPGLSVFHTFATAEDMYFYFNDSDSPLLTSDVSDGTLRALALLTAIFQPIGPYGAKGDAPSLIAIEEPELYLHPGATQLLLDAMRHPGHRKQIVVSSHSPVALDELQPDNPLESVLTFELRDGETIIEQMPKFADDVVRERLSTYGKLLSQGQLVPSGDK